MTLTPTEIESLRIAIAEECGWREILWSQLTNPHEAIESKHYCRDNSKRRCGWLPPYTTSLDAIQAAAIERFKEYRDRIEFDWNMGKMTSGDFCHWQLTALDWSIAFARTAKIWKYKV